MTAFREGMAVHGRYRQPCPVCGSPVQRVAYADNELNYCARCQTGGRLLADRAMSKLLREDWPRTLEELEEQTAARLAPGGVMYLTLSTHSDLTRFRGLIAAAGFEPRLVAEHSIWIDRLLLLELRQAS